MKIAFPITIPVASKGGSAEVSPKIKPEKKESFGDMLSQVEKLVQKKNVLPQELLGAQIACHHYQLQVEMVSKCAEGASATLRKLQQGS